MMRANTIHGEIEKRKFIYIFSDKYNLINNNNLNLGWLLDFRSLIEINLKFIQLMAQVLPTNKIMLTREISLANLDYKKKITDNGKFTAGISAKNTNQNKKPEC